MSLRALQLNEAFHCSVMESLGGDKKWSDRFTAFHAAVAYYWFLVVQFLLSPAESYAFSQALEAHAVDTYGQFIEENEMTLKLLPPPQVARAYFTDFLYYFDEFQMGDGAARRPVISTLHDVFVNILQDEREHTKTMGACVDYTRDKKAIRHKGREISADARDSARKRMSREDRRAYWKKWSKSQAPPDPDGEETSSP